MSEEKQPELDLVPIWDAFVAAGGLTCSTTVLALRVMLAVIKHWR